MNTAARKPPDGTFTNLPPPQSWAADFSAIAEEAGLSTRDLSKGYALLVETWKTQRHKLP